MSAATNPDTSLRYDYSTEPRKPKLPSFIVFDRENVGSRDMPKDRFLLIARRLLLAVVAWCVVMALLPQLLGVA